MSVQSPFALKSRPVRGAHEKSAYVDIDYIAVQEPSGPIGMKTIEFHRGQKLTGYALEVAERHGIELRWK